MALGYGNRDDDVTPPMEQTNFGKEGYYDGFNGDAEKGVGRNAGGGRKMSRIDKPITKSIGGLNGGNDLTSDDATDPSISVGKQMELEAGNAIKYRTCSWQKV